MSYQVRDSYLSLILAELDAPLRSNMAKVTVKVKVKATDKDLLLDLLLVTVATLVMAADSLSHRPPALLPVLTLSTFHPCPTIVGEKPHLVYQQLDFESQAMAMVQHRRHRQIRSHQRHRTSLVPLPPSSTAQVGWSSDHRPI